MSKQARIAKSGKCAPAFTTIGALIGIAGTSVLVVVIQGRHKGKVCHVVDWRSKAGVDVQFTLLQTYGERFIIDLNDETANQYITVLK